MLFTRLNLSIDSNQLALCINGANCYVVDSAVSAERDKLCNRFQGEIVVVELQLLVGEVIIISSRTYNY